MLKERIQEIFEFSKSESPYRKANKGWINKDIFLDLSPASDAFKQKDEAAKVTLFWSPINSLLSNIFLVVIICSILIFTSLSFVKGRFDFNLFNKSGINDIEKVDQDKSLSILQLEDVDSDNSSLQENLDTKDLDKSNGIELLEDDLIKEEKKMINEKIDKQDSLIKENKSTEDIKIMQNKIQKSNFI